MYGQISPEDKNNGQKAKFPQIAIDGIIVSESMGQKHQCSDKIVHIPTDQCSMLDLPHLQYRDTPGDLWSGSSWSGIRTSPRPTSEMRNEEWDLSHNSNEIYKVTCIGNICNM